MERLEDYKKANAYCLRCMRVTWIVMIIAWVLNVVHIFILDQSIMDHTFIGITSFAIAGYLVKYIIGFDKIVANYLMISLLVGMITFANVEVAYHGTLFMLFPMVCAILYNENKYVTYTFILTCIGFLVSVVFGFKYGLCDSNMLILTVSTTENEAAKLLSNSFSINDDVVSLVLFYVVPRCMALFGFASVLDYLKKSIQEKTLREQESLQMAESERLANQAKSHFLAQMSHEIRTPINAVLGMNEMILHKSRDKEITEYSSNIKKAGKTLLVLINSILDFSKIEDGKMEIIPAEYDFPSVLNNLINSVAARAKAKSLDFNVDVDETLPVTLFGDDLRVSQVIINLLTNAVKYTEEGCISLSIKEFARDGKKITLDVDVSDTGIGIRAEDMDKLFESFGRLDEKRNRGIEGTGLGMAIVTKLLEMMGSELKVSSEYGVGSSFSFRIVQEIVNDEPIGKLNERFERARKQESSREYLYAPAASVLVVDDNEMNCKVAKNLMKQNGIVPDFAFSGEEAIGKIRKKFYNIVFLDHMMPKMDGIETLEHLKEEKLIPEGTVVVALTANAVVGAKETYLNAGFDDYLSKPIEIEDLEAKLWKYLPSDMTEKRILSAEENTAGKTDKRKTSPERIKTGSREISEKDVREILEFEPSGDKGCFGQGGDDEILEFAPDEGDVPEFGPGETDILEFGPDEDGELYFGDDDASGIDITVLIETLNDIGLDTDAALRYCAGDKAFYRELLEEYVSSSDKKSTDLEGFFAAGDMKEYKTLVHSMKSSSKTIGKLDLFEAARDLEAAALAEDTDYVAEHHPGFIRAYLAFCKTLSVLL